MGLGVLVAASIVQAILDRSMDNFNDSGWIYPLFVAILFGYGIAGWQAGRAAPGRRAHERHPRRDRRAGAVDPGAHRDLARAGQQQRPVHRPPCPRCVRGSCSGRSSSRRDSGCSAASSAPGQRPAGRTRRRRLLGGSESAGWPRIGMPSGGIGSRNVRTPQGTVLGNTQSGRPAGQCNREQTADGGAVLGPGRTGKGETVR